MFQGLATERSQAVAVPLVYGLLEATCIPLYCIWAWKAGWTKAPPGESLWVVLAKSYESCDDDTNHPHAGALEEADACQDAVLWMGSDSTISYSPVGVQEINTSLIDDEKPSKYFQQEDEDETETSLARKLTFERKNTLETDDSEESFV